MILLNICVQSKVFITDHVCFIYLCLEGAVSLWETKTVSDTVPDTGLEIKYVAISLLRAGTRHIMNTKVFNPIIPAAAFCPGEILFHHTFT